MNISLGVLLISVKEAQNWPGDGTCFPADDTETPRPVTDVTQGPF